MTPLPDLSGQKVLVTGGTGFIGGRLVERLIQECGAEVRVLVRHFSKATRIGRFPVEMVPGNVAERDEVERAVDGCSIVFHCTYGNSGDVEEQRRVNVDGMRYVLEAAGRHGASRVVSTSTLAVYGDTPDGDLDETARRDGSGDAYAEQKLAAEELCLAAARERGVPATVLQPAMVCGPFGPAWTLRILNDLKNRRVVLVNGGDGLCNAVYVDDVVSALILAAVKDEAVGEAFLVAGEEPVTWREFYGRHEEMLGFESTISLSASEAEARWAEMRRPKGIVHEGLALLREEPNLRHRVRWAREVDALTRVARKVVPAGARRAIKAKLTGRDPDAAARAALAPPKAPAAPEKPLLLMPPGAIKMHAAKTRVRIDKAKRLLGYRPAFDFPAAMARIETWARWANLLEE